METCCKMPNLAFNEKGHIYCINCRKVVNMFGEMKSECDRQNNVSVHINVDPFMTVGDVGTAMKNIADSIAKTLNKECVIGKIGKEIEPTNRDIAMEVFKEIAQDYTKSPQDRMDACKLLLEHNC